MALSAESKKKNPTEFEITIRLPWCKGCEFCVETCPQGVLRMEGVKAVVDRGADCTGCELCVWICPDFAIQISESPSSLADARDEGET